MKLSIVILLSFVIFSCNNNDNKADAYGNFEADEITLSSEVNGKILDMYIEEGDEVKAGDKILQIDTTQLYLQKLGLLANSESVSDRLLDVNSQIDVYTKKIEILNREKKRVEDLLKSGASTQKQLDDISGEIESTEKMIIATRKKLFDTNRGILSQNKPIYEQIKVIDDQILRAELKAPTVGRILSIYTDRYEFARIGAPLVKIANTKKMYLKAYIDGKNLSKVKLGANAEVMFDNSNGTLDKVSGKVVYISDKAEFTPKIVQTKDQRVNLVYSVKILVNNDGRIKIGMPGEVNFN